MPRDMRDDLLVINNVRMNFSNRPERGEEVEYFQGGVCEEGSDGEISYHHFRDDTEDANRLVVSMTRIGVQDTEFATDRDSLSASLSFHTNLNLGFSGSWDLSHDAYEQISTAHDTLKAVMRAGILGGRIRADVPLDANDRAQLADDLRADKMFGDGDRIDVNYIPVTHKHGFMSDLQQLEFSGGLPEETLANVRILLEKTRSAYNAEQTEMAHQILKDAAHIQHVFNQAAKLDADDIDAYLDEHLEGQAERLAFNVKWLDITAVEEDFKDSLNKIFNMLENAQDKLPEDYRNAYGISDTIRAFRKKPGLSP